jgi:hypothetical protein
MGPPKVYSTIDYRETLPESFSVEELMTADRAGTINALRFITKNPVGIFEYERRSADWYMPYMSLALPYPLTVEAGDAIRIRFQYDAGASVESLQASIQAHPA